MTTAQAYEQLRAAMHRDSAYAWSWHCNLACAVMDEGVDHATANLAAARFMTQTFGIELSPPHGKVEAAVPKESLDAMCGSENT